MNNILKLFQKVNEIYPRDMEYPRHCIIYNHILNQMELHIVGCENCWIFTEEELEMDFDSLLELIIIDINKI